MDNMIIFMLAGIGGVLFQSLVKLQSLLKDARVANVNFNWKKDYVYRDFPSIALSFLSVGLWLLAFGEVAAKYPALQGWAVCSFVLMGAIGSWLIQFLIGTAKDRIRAIVDKKTDIADGKIPNQ